MRPIDADAFAVHVALYMGQNAYLNDTALDVLKKVSRWLDEEPTLDYAPSQQWISVEDRLPEKDWEGNQKWYSKVVLAATGRSVLYGSFEVYKYNGTWEFTSYDEDLGFDRCVTVTHWMPLPTPPKEDER